MIQIYENFIWWLTLWLPDHTDLAWKLDDAAYDQRAGEFWFALSPERFDHRPMRFDAELLRVLTHGVKSRIAVQTRSKFIRESR